ncbi:hypothetical protein MGYG_05381 [Nannizzia gypsea CBS 118893]|uniref:GPI inositol-deacylase n=1 Tax=Arthroderma gypseum (strain ATCC MYA-4604 / CBS 118893) TaxID=535722 RepID=E4UVQ8_ARTGP|nr:hypothetical protein MGYG_05381 [Nannizzia gypsea CBS 118893]EFR02385.1 hypothetical protein MGYG_05381 [Nannizzia gypsea CBS 118893]
MAWVAPHGERGHTIGDVKNLWLPWLHEETGLSRTRVFTFGYNANYAQGTASLSILDFAKNLLFQINAYRDENNKPIGSHPLIFVAHSMGGLVVKKAYILGKLIEQYSDIISQVAGMIFLATPHRGSNFASTLNAILRMSPTTGAKTYVNELEDGSVSIDDINEQFRNVCGGLYLISFYETYKTAISPGVKVKVVEKQSAVLGYPQEVSAPLNADHNGISKYLNREDSNYKAVRNALRMIVQRNTEKGYLNGESAKLPAPNFSGIGSILGIQELGDELEVISEPIQPGSCRWILEKKSFQDWAGDGAPGLNILWLTGLPGVGKSTLSSFIINHFKQLNVAASCQYYFFRVGQHKTRTMSHFLRSLAFQVAEDHESFRSRLVECHQTTGIRFVDLEYTVIWRRIFEGILFQCTPEQPLTWVFDGIDEAEFPITIMKLMATIKSKLPIRLLLVSRETRELSLSMSLSGCRIDREDIQIDDTIEDIRSFVSMSLSRNIQDKDILQSVIDKVLSKSSGSFLWAKVAVDSIKDNWHTDSDIDYTLANIPDGMELMYEQMMDSVINQPPNLLKMASEILTWVACAFRPLSLDELAVALKPQFGNFYNLKVTIRQICGGFVIIRNSSVIIIHETASQFLASKHSDASIIVDTRIGHARLARRCMNYLSQGQWKTELATIHATRELALQDPYEKFPFLSYAIAHWTYHTSCIPIEMEDLQADVLEFLSQFALVWIYAISLTGDFHIIISSAHYLRKFAKRIMYHLTQNHASNPKENQSQRLVLWSTELIRLVGRFGQRLLESPSSIYRHIIPFCPSESIFAQEFRHLSQNTLRILGLASSSWDDCLARITTGNDEEATKISGNDNMFVIMLDSGTLVIWSSETLLEIGRLDHRETTTCIKVAGNKNIVASAGEETVRVWDFDLEEELLRTSNPEGIRAISLAFRVNDTQLLIAYNDYTIECIGLNTLQKDWASRVILPSEYQYGPPRDILFSPDTSKIAVVHATRPLAIWRTDYPKHPPQRFMRQGSGYQKYQTWRENSIDIVNSPRKVVWKPDSGGLMVSYPGIVLIDWSLDDDTQSEYPHIVAHEIAISSDGKLLLTCDHHNTIHIWNTSSFRLLYKLNAGGNGILRDIAFSSDSRQIYDLRDTVCHIWEPAVLKQPEEYCRGDKGFQCSETLTSHEDTDKHQVSAVTCCDKLPYYCVGKEDGSITIYETRTASSLGRLYKHPKGIGIIGITWSPSSKYLASTDNWGRVFVKRLIEPAPATPQKWTVYKAFNLNPESGVKLLFSTSEEYLLVSNSECDQLWSITSKSKVLEVKRKGDSYYRRWVNHPESPKLLVCIEMETQYIHTWNNLERIVPQNEAADGQVLKYGPTPFSTIALDAPERIFLIQDRSLVLEHSVNNRYNCDTQPYASSSRQIVIIDFDDMQLQRRVLRELSSQVSRLVGVYQGQLAFLNHDYWLCTWDLESDENSYRKHFFLPKDWILPDTLDLITMDCSGNLLFPRNGEVAVIQSQLRLWD